MPKDQQDKESSNSPGKLHPLLDPAKRELIEANLEKILKAYSSGDPVKIREAIREMPGSKKLHEREAQEAAARKSRGEQEEPDTLS